MHVVVMGRWSKVIFDDLLGEILYKNDEFKKISKTKFVNLPSVIDIPTIHPNDL